MRKVSTSVDALVPDDDLHAASSFLATPGYIKRYVVLLTSRKTRQIYSLRSSKRRQCSVGEMLSQMAVLTLI